MKNKRTKLTAILLSALMAVSTISSVTWAADLFSDGSDVVEEESVESVPEVEDEIVADDLSLNDIGNMDGIESVEFQYRDKDGNETGDPTKAEKVVAVFSLKLGTGSNQNADPQVIDAKLADDLPTYHKDGSCSAYEKAIYRAEYGTVKVYSNEDGIVKVSTKINASYGYDDDGFIPIPVSKAPLGHQYSSTGVPRDFVIENASCETEGIKILYNSCSKCDALYTGLTNHTFPGTKGRTYISDSNGFIDSNEAKKHSIKLNDLIKDLLGETNGVLNNSVDLDGDKKSDIWTEAIPVNYHNYDESNPIPLTQYNFTWSGIDPDGDGQVTAGDYVDLGTSSYPNYSIDVQKKYVLENKPSAKSDYKLFNKESLVPYAPFNALLVGSEMQIADPENGLDAYYYTIVKCKNCNTVKIYDKIYLKDTQGFKAGDYYERVKGGNILGFLAKPNSPGNDIEVVPGSYVTSQVFNYKFISFNKRTRISTTDSRLLNPLVPVLENCQKEGYYYIRTYASDVPKDPVHSEMKKVDRQSHVWGSIEVAPKDFDYSDKTKSKTEKDNLLIEGSSTDETHSQGVVVVRDNQGNVTEAKSKDCITKAKYELYHICLICGQKNKVEEKTADYNTDRHQWPKDWEDPVEADSKYYDLGDGTHKKFTYKHRNCELCGLRALQLDNEYIENHNLVETRYDDEGEDETLVPATCGENGHYDVILRCACGFEDKESRKQTIIPATDQHDFGDNPAQLFIEGEIQVGRDAVGEAESDIPSHVIYAYVARKCNICGNYDSNGINNTAPGVGGDIVGTSVPAIGPTVIIDTTVEGRTFSDYVAAKKDPSTGVTYPCSTGKITVNFNWAGKVDDETKKFSDSKTVPYYLNDSNFAGSRAHQADDVRIEGKVDATTEAPGHYDRVVYCSVCGDEVSRETVEIAQIGSAPSIKATPANYNTINITWDAVEGADHYRLYYKSSDVGVTTWKLVRTVNGTSFTHSGLVTGAKYRYTVRAVLNGVNGEYDRKGSVAIPKLAAPENVAVTAVSGKNKISWNKVDGANGYIIQRSTGSGWTRVGSVKKGAKVTWTDKKPVSGATYRVRAYRTVNDANFSKNNVYSAFSAAK